MPQRDQANGGHRPHDKYQADQQQQQSEQRGRQAGMGNGGDTASEQGDAHDAGHVQQYRSSRTQVRRGSNPDSKG